MVAQYAKPVRSELYLDDPDYTSLFPPQIHQDAIISDHASVECSLDLYGRDGAGSNIGTVNAHSGNFTSLCAPNCKPERLGLISYTVEYGFLYDVDSDNALDERDVLHENKMLHQTLNQSPIASISTTTSEIVRRKFETQAKIAAEFLRLDPTFATLFFSKWERFTGSITDVRKQEFASLNDYLAFRVDDVGAPWGLSALRWGTGIYLTPEEEQIADPMNYIAYAVLALTNDLFSWENEYKIYLKSKGNIPWANAVHFVMIWQKLSPDEAKAIIRAEIRAHEERFCFLKNKYMATSHQSQSIIDLLKLLENTMAGNFFWCLRSPRYKDTERNPYHDHLETFRSHNLRVITPVTQFSDSTADTNGTNSNVSHLLNPTTLWDSLSKPLTVYLTNEETILNPYIYITSLPSKNVRRRLISALNIWYMVPEKSLSLIDAAVDFLHNSSLLLDDIQDGSSLRRGKPVAHQIFGIGQTINTATYLMNEALCAVQKLSESALPIYSKEIRNLHLGQGQDLHWSYHTHIPTVEQYISMTDGKTGGLFRLICGLMKSEATLNRELDVGHFATLLGRYFQIRDDYQNLTSVEYKQKKGFCDDFDEGKISFPVILSMQSEGFSNEVIRSVFKDSRQRRTLTPEVKQYILEQVTAQGALSETSGFLDKLYLELLHLLKQTEKEAGDIENWTLRLLIVKLNVSEKARIEEADRMEKDASAWKDIQRRSWASKQDDECF